MSLRRRSLFALFGLCPALIYPVLVYPVLILLTNFLIACKLFLVEYTAYWQSNEGTLVAITRQVAAHPADLRWWPLWNCGLPFQNTYLPLLPVLAAGFSRLTGHSAALSYHQICAAFFCCAPVALYFMAWGITRRPIPSFFASLAFSILSPCAWMVPAIRTDLGGAWYSRRLQNLVFYGEGPHQVSIAFLPLAILFLYLSITRKSLWLKVAAGLFIGATVLANAFGAVILALVAACLLATIQTDRFWNNAGILFTVGVAAYCWISPLVPPSVLAAIRLNSPTVERDYRFTDRSLAGVCVLFAGLLLLWWVTRRTGSAPWRFFLLFAFLTNGIVFLGGLAQIYVVPQPHRYQLEADMGVCLLVIFGGAELLSARAPRLLRPAAAVLALLLLFQFRNDLNYAHRSIRGTDITSSASYRVARWMDEHMDGQRVMVSGSYSFQFNEITDTPQFYGGHEPMQLNPIMRIAYFVVLTGMNAGARDGEISALWLEAMGTHAVSVPGPRSSEYYKPIVNPLKFEGVLPVLWREGDDTIYAIPARSNSLAHVLPPEAIVRDAPVNGLDVSEIERYVNALDDPTLPEAKLFWRDRHTAGIQAQLEPDQVVSVQITHDPGWHATIAGVPQKVERDGLGFLFLKPACRGECEITLYYDGGPEWRATCLASLMVMGAVLCLLVLGAG